MSGFQVGDVVVCVDASPCRNRVLSPTVTLRRGKLFRVTGMTPAQGNSFYVLLNDEPPHLIEGYVFRGGWDDRRFCKIDRADEHFTETIRACKPERIGDRNPG
jgi:hypothetical protein